MQVSKKEDGYKVTGYDKIFKNKEDAEKQLKAMKRAKDERKDN